MAIEEFIYRPYITLRDGRRLWAKQYGKKVFRIRVRKPEPPEDDTTPEE